MTRACADMKVLLHGHLDGELDAANALEVEEHLKGCDACAREYRQLTALRTVLRQDGVRHRAPDALRGRILQAIEPARPAAPAAAAPAMAAPARWWRNLWGDRRLGIPAAAFAAGLALVLVWPRPSPDLERELVSEHVRSLMANHITDVTTSDQHTVKPWFDGRLDFAPPVIDLSGQGFPLIGGRLDYIAGRAVAALVYRRGGHPINLFVWPAETPGIGPASARASVDNGYNVLHWSEGGMTFWAVSDLNAGELQDFMRIFASQTGHP